VVRYADDFVVLVDSSGDDAGDDVARLREEITDLLAPLGLRLSPAKTGSCVCHARRRER
jgi:RNA-directed DNA polymerase